MIDYISIVSEVVDAKKKVNNVYINFLRQKKGRPIKDAHDQRVITNYESEESDSGRQCRV